MRKQVKIEVAPGGEVTIEVSGFKGRACKEITADLEAELGSVVSEELTPEYYEPEQRQHNDSRVAQR